LEKLKVKLVDGKLKRYKTNWLGYLKRRNNKMPIIMLNAELETK
jgi:hypothetical protein